MSGRTDGEGENAYGEEGAQMELVADRLLRRQLPGKQKPLVMCRGCQSSGSGDFICLTRVSSRVDLRSEKLHLTEVSNGENTQGGKS